MVPPQGDGAEPQPLKGSQQGPEGNNSSGAANQDKPTGEKQHMVDPQAPNDNTKVSSSTCKPVATHRPEVELPSDRINGRIKFMQDHALIGKFMGFWPNEKALRGWINHKWKTKGEITLLLGPKGFFTAIFNSLEDRNRVFDGGPYFFNSAGLYLREWVARFNPDKEDLSYAPVWIRLYSLPWEYWGEESLKSIGSVIGDFVKVAEETKTVRYSTYASYARICVYMDLKQPFPDTVRLFHEDHDWIQVIDYE